MLIFFLEYLLYAIKLLKTVTALIIKTIYKHNANVDTDYSNKDEINFNKIKQEYMKNPNDPTISKKYKESLKQYLLNKHDGNKITGKYKDDPVLGISLKRIENYKNKNFIAKQIQRLNNWARSMESKLNSPFLFLAPQALHQCLNNT